MLIKIKAFGRQQTPDTRQKIAAAMQGNQNRKGTGNAQPAAPPMNYSAPKVNPNPPAGSATPNTGELEGQIQGGVDRKFDYQATNAAGQKNNARALVQAMRDRRLNFLTRLQYAIANASRRAIAARWNIPDITNTTPASPMVTASEVKMKKKFEKQEEDVEEKQESPEEEANETPEEERAEPEEKDEVKKVKKRIQKLKSMVADLSQ